MSKFDEKLICRCVEDDVLLPMSYCLILLLVLYLLFHFSMKICVWNKSIVDISSSWYSIYMIHLMKPCTKFSIKIINYHKLITTIHSLYNLYCLIASSILYIFWFTGIFINDASCYLHYYYSTYQFLSFNLITCHLSH